MCKGDLLPVLFCSSHTLLSLSAALLCAASGYLEIPQDCSARPVYQDVLLPVPCTSFYKHPFLSAVHQYFGPDRSVYTQGSSAWSVYQDLPIPVPCSSSHTLPSLFAALLCADSVCSEYLQDHWAPSVYQGAPLPVFSSSSHTLHSRSWVLLRICRI